MKLLREEVAAGSCTLAFGLHALDVLGRDEVEGLWREGDRGQPAFSPITLFERDSLGLLMRTSRKRSVHRMRHASSLGVSEVPGLVMHRTKLRAVVRETGEMTCLGAVACGTRTYHLSFIFYSRGANTRRVRGDHGKTTSARRSAYIDEFLSIREGCVCIQSVLGVSRRGETGSAPSC